MIRDRTPAEVKFIEGGPPGYNPTDADLAADIRTAKNVRGFERWLNGPTRPTFGERLKAFLSRALN